MLGADRDSCVVFDPLDGSSNIDAGVNVGTIFGVYKVVSRIPFGTRNDWADTLSERDQREQSRTFYDLVQKWWLPVTQCTVHPATWFCPPDKVSTDSPSTNLSENSSSPIRKSPSLLEVKSTRSTKETPCTFILPSHLIWRVSNSQAMENHIRQGISVRW